MKFLSAVVVILLFLFGAAGSRAVELVLYNWDSYIADSVLEKFERQTGHTIKQVIFDSDTERDEVLVNTQGRGFDLVVVESISNQTLGENGYLHPIKPELFNSIEPLWKDACGPSGVPYVWGSMGIVYRPDAVKEAPSSWRALMSPEPEHQGRVGMMLDSVDTLIPPLKLLGKSINEEDREALKVAHAMLVEQKPHVQTYEYVGSFEALDKIHMALAFSGDLYVLSEREETEWSYTIPDEGTGFWLDCMAIPETSSHKAEAMAFIEFLNRPEIAAENASELWVATPNKEALPLLDEELLDDDQVFPAKAVMDSSEIYQRLSNKNLSLRNRIIYSLER